MLLLTKQNKKDLPKLYEQDGKGDQAIAYVKFFTPDSNWTWYATEFDGEDTFFGLVDGFEMELGYFSLSEIKSARGPLRLAIERDLHWRPTMIGKIKYGQDWEPEPAKVEEKSEPTPEPEKPDYSFTFYADAGHGWLRVPATLLNELGIEDKITSFSYAKGNYVYLEEDCDYMTFYEAVCKNGQAFETKTVHSKRSSIRNYPAYIPPITPEPVKTAVPAKSAAKTTRKARKPRKMTTRQKLTKIWAILQA